MIASIIQGSPSVSLLLSLIIAKRRDTGMCIRVLQIDFPRYWLQCTKHVQLFSGV